MKNTNINKTNVYSKSNLQKMRHKTKDEAYASNLNKYKYHWIAKYINGDNITYFESLVFKHIAKETKNFISKTISKQIFIGYKQMSQ